MDIVTTPSSAPRNTPTARYQFRARHRLSGALEFAAVHRQGVRRPRGPIIVLVRPNELDCARLGLSVSRKVGGAVRRNTIKRRLREAFRLLRPTMPGGCDLVIIVRPHEPLPMGDYQKLLASGWESAQTVIDRQTGRKTSTP